VGKCIVEVILNQQIEGLIGGEVESGGEKKDGGEMSIKTSRMPGTRATSLSRTGATSRV
jgi:hypothetical protein